MWVLMVLAVGFVLGVSFIHSVKGKSAAPAMVIAGVAVFVLLGLGLASIRFVPAGYAGVVDFFGKVSPEPLKSGINFVNPLAKVVNISTRTQEETETMSVPSKEGLNVALDVSALYKLDPSKVVEIYKTIGPHYRNIVLIPQFRAAARGVTVGHEAKALYTSEREMLTQAIHDSLSSLVKDRGVMIERVLLRAITLPVTVSAAVEQKLKAEQEAERMKFVLQREQQEAERKRVEAAGIRDSQTIISQSLTPQYLHYLWINTLNQNPNVIYVATEANMPMFRAVDPDKELVNRKPVVSEERKKEAKQ